ncbi:MAG: YraN family protein [Candidatus Aminicenantes bacterium]|nr:YraN family protein [Candidatus Aminicenantes bacterium]
MTDVRRTTRALGRAGEDIACEYLERKKYTIVARGFRLFRGEIDIIARDGETLVFVEVKARADESHGRPEESVTPGKQRQIRRIALGYLQAHPCPGVDCRFDVIAILFRSDRDYRLEHFIDAF